MGGDDDDGEEGIKFGEDLIFGESKAATKERKYSE